MLFIAAHTTWPESHANVGGWHFQTLKCYFMACKKKCTLTSCPHVGVVPGLAKDEQESGKRDVMSHHGVMSQRKKHTNASELPRRSTEEL